MYHTALKATTAPFEETEIVVDLLREPPVAKPNPGGKPMPLIMGEAPTDGGGDDDGSSGQLIIACFALVSACLKKEDPQKPDPKIPPPVPPPDVWATLFPDCVAKSGDSIIGYFIRNPFHEPPASAKGKKIILNFVAPNCIQPYTGQEQTVGKYKILVDNVEADTHLPMKLSLTGKVVA